MKFFFSVGLDQPGVTFREWIRELFLGIYTPVSFRVMMFAFTIIFFFYFPTILGIKTRKTKKRGKNNSTNELKLNVTRTALECPH